jgi:hypothetical protein
VIDRNFPRARLIWQQLFELIKQRVNLFEHCTDFPILRFNSLLSAVMEILRYPFGIAFILVPQVGSLQLPERSLSRPLGRIRPETSGLKNAEIIGTRVCATKKLNQIPEMD